MNRAPFLIALALLSGCTAAPMQPDAYSRYVEADRQRVATLPPCCAAWRDVDFSHQITADVTEFRLGAPSAQAKDINGVLTPIAGFRLPNDAALQIEFQSYSDGHHGMLRFDNRLFVRPNAVFLDGNFNVITESKNPPMCNGAYARGFALWHRFAIDNSAARYVVFYPSVAQSTQQIDTRQGSGLMPGTQMIADMAGKTYLANVNMGYTGLIGVRAVKQTEPLIGRCVDEEISSTTDKK